MASRKAAQEDNGTSLKITEEDTPSSPAAAIMSHEKELKVAKSLTMHKSLNNILLRQYECSICLEPMACAMSLHQCGDTFCYGADVSVLSSGGVALLISLPNRMVDNSVREILRQEDPELLALWEQKTQQGLLARKARIVSKTGSK
eukprot:gene32984-39893_t